MLMPLVPYARHGAYAVARLSRSPDRLHDDERQLVGVPRRSSPAAVWKGRAGHGRITRHAVVTRVLQRAADWTSRDRRTSARRLQRSREANACAAPSAR